MKHRFPSVKASSGQFRRPAREGMATSFAGRAGKVLFVAQVPAQFADMELWKTGGWRP